MSNCVDWCADADNYWLIRYVYGGGTDFVIYARLGDSEVRCVWFIPMTYKEVGSA